MYIKKREPFIIQTTQLAAMIKWYSDTLGLSCKEPPGPHSSGVWLYADDTALVHLVEVSEQKAIFSEQSQKPEYYSLSAFGAPQFEARLEKLKMHYENALPKETTTVLYKLWDPDGNAIHIDFPAIELLMEQVAS